MPRDCKHGRLQGEGKSRPFHKILLNKNIPKRIIFIYNNDIAAAKVELWSSSTNAKYAENSSTNYILCKKQIKV